MGANSMHCKRKPLSLLNLLYPFKAKLLLRSGADVWLPYMIPLCATITKLGSNLVEASGDCEIYAELLNSPFIDDEHCVIRAQQDLYTVFDRARFNNTLVDQKPVPPEGCTLATGAVIALGSVEYLFVYNHGT
jgi:hypothetical protein